MRGALTGGEGVGAWEVFFWHRGDRLCPVQVELRYTTDSILSNPIPPHLLAGTKEARKEGEMGTPEVGGRSLGRSRPATTKSGGGGGGASWCQLNDANIDTPIFQFFIGGPKAHQLDCFR